MNTPDCAVLVDAYSTGKYLAPAFRRRGILCRHVQSQDPIPSVAAGSFVPADFVSNDILDPGHARLPELIERIAAYRPRFVIAGSEIGVLLADQISESLGLPTNGTALSRTRRDKHEMQEALRRAGVPCMLHRSVSDPKEALHAAKELGSRVVVKPAASAGAEDVYFCRELDAVSSAFGRVQGKTNALGDLNREVVIQELLEGDEYIVNTVSANGVHRVTDIWRCEKILMPGYGKLSALEELLPFEGAEQATLTCYVHRVLHAVGILHGPAHIELIMTRSGPRLMEVAARLQGAVDPSALTAALGTTHIDQTVDAYIDPYGFASRALIPYELKQRVFRVFVICHRTGQLLSIPGIPKLQSLSSFFAAVFYKQPGTRIAQTIDYFTSPGLVHLVHADRFRLQRDYVSLRALEKDGLFEIQS